MVWVWEQSLKAKEQRSLLGSSPSPFCLVSFSGTGESRKGHFGSNGTKGGRSSPKKSGNNSRPYPWALFTGCCSENLNFGSRILTFAVVEFDLGNRFQKEFLDIIRIPIHSLNNDFPSHRLFIVFPTIIIRRHRN